MASAGEASTQDTAAGPTGSQDGGDVGGAPGTVPGGGGSFYLSLESVRHVSESIHGPTLPEEAARELSEQTTFRIRTLVQNARKFMMHSKRRKLTREDLDLACRVEGLEPLYGAVASEHVPFRYASGGGREFHFAQEKELDLQDLTSGALPKIPLAPSLRAHWLAIDGVQPSIPENPPSASKEQLLTDASNPLGKLTKHDATDNKLGALLQNQKPSLAAARLKTTETVNVKQLAKHELSVEQQLYYKEITEACVGSDESRRAEALQSLASDPGLHQMLPRLCTFIAEGVRVNVVQHNLAILIYLMRMVKSLLENQTLFLEKYLHELIPAVTTCLVARQLCARPDVDNHWALRDFASRLMANICKNFNTSTNNIQTRMTRVFAESLRAERSPLVSYYGAIAGLQELGPEVIKVFIVPHIKAVSVRIDQATEAAALMGTTNIEKTAAQHIRNLIVKSVTPVLKCIRSPPDVLEEYKAEFGSIGVYLHGNVQRNRSSGSANAGGTGSNHGVGGPAMTALGKPGAGGTTPLRPVMVTQHSTSGPPTPSTPGTPTIRPGQQLIHVVNQAGQGVQMVGTAPLQQRTILVQQGAAVPSVSSPTTTTNPVIFQNPPSTS